MSAHFWMHPGGCMEPLPSKEEMNPGHLKAVPGYLVQIYPATVGVGSIQPLRGTSWTVGRKSDCDIRLSDGSISRHHARIETASDGHYVRDLKSFNGTFVNEQQIEHSKLRDGDYVRFGNFMFRYLTGDPEQGHFQAVYGPTLDDSSTISTNATFFIETMLASAARTKRALSVLQIELTFSESTDPAEPLLTELTTRVRSVLRKDDLLACSTAGKFTIVLPDTDHDHALQMAATLRQLLENSNGSGNKSLELSVRIGVSTTAGQERLTSAELLRRANESVS